MAHEKFGLMAEELSGKSWPELVSREDRDSVQCALLRLQRGDGVLRGVYGRLSSSSRGATAGVRSFERTWSMCAFEARSAGRSHALVLESLATEVDTYLFRQLSVGFAAVSAPVPGAAVFIPSARTVPLPIPSEVLEAYRGPSDSDGLRADASLVIGMVTGADEEKSGEGPAGLDAKSLQALMRSAEVEVHHSMHTVEVATAEAAEAITEEEEDTKRALLEATVAGRYADAVSRVLMTAVRLREGNLTPVPGEAPIRSSILNLMHTLRLASRSSMVLSVHPAVPPAPGLDSTLIDLWIRAAVAVPAVSSSTSDPPITVAISIGRKDPSLPLTPAAAKAAASSASAGSKQATSDVKWIFVEVIDGGPPLAPGTPLSLADLEATLAPEPAHSTAPSSAAAPIRPRRLVGNRARRLALFAPVLRRVAEGLMLGSTGIDTVGGASRTWLCVPFRTRPEVPVPEADSAEVLKSVPDALCAKIGDSNLPKLFFPCTEAHHVIEEEEEEEGEEGEGKGAGGGGGKGGGEGGGGEGDGDGSAGGGRRWLGLDSGEATPLRPGITTKRVRVRGRGGATAQEPLNLRVLLVDDSTPTRRAGEGFLKRLGCTVVTRGDGDEVEEAIQSNPPFDVVLLDIIMMRTGGDEACELLRKKLNFNRAIIAVTARTEPAHIQEYYDSGFDVVLQKPFSIQDLRVKLVEGMQRRGGGKVIRRLDAKLPSTQAMSGDDDSASPAMPPVIAEDSAAAEQVDLQSTSARVTPSDP